MPAIHSPLPYGRQWIDDDDVAAVVECLRGDWLTQGPTIEKFEQALCQATGAKHAVAVASGTAALHLAALACGIQPGNSGVTSAITFVASANCMAYCGGEPHFADVDPTTGLMDLASLEARLKELAAAGNAAKLIVPVDFAGQPADLPAIRKLADQHGAKVVEDAAHSLGASYRSGDQVCQAGSCTHTDAAILSFHPVKHVTTAEGGAVMTNDAALAERVRTLRTHGIHRDPKRFTRPDEGPWYHEQAELGFHYRITDLQCALGVSQMKKLQRFVARRNDLARQYDRELAPLAEHIVPLRQRTETKVNGYHLYVVRLVRRPKESLEQLAARRKKLFLALREVGILTQIHYIPVPMQPYFRERAGELGAGAAEYYASCLSLPLFPRMEDADVARVVSSLQVLLTG